MSFNITIFDLFDRLQLGERILSNARSVGTYRGRYILHLRGRVDSAPFSLG